MEALDKVFKITGSKSALARLLDISPAAISQWDKVPLPHCFTIEKITNGQVRCEELRPDIDWSVLRQPSA
ncbi:transcriptional regulator [Chrysiogenes arsenatis]|uniref:transcriptional regulator n=1 Tax=Chrysiogenes arsenatis TaxID=309797 RepID=UPI00041EF5FF|nr:helix-turn-helix domain-containing protein [Chrysiogenes arsenatis]